MNDKHSVQARQQPQPPHWLVFVVGIPALLLVDILFDPGFLWSFLIAFSIGAVASVIISLLWRLR
jgi:hypothetical protein